MSVFNDFFNLSREEQKQIVTEYNQRKNIENTELKIQNYINNKKYLSECFKIPFDKNVPFYTYYKIISVIANTYTKVSVLFFEEYPLIKNIPKFHGKFYYEGSLDFSGINIDEIEIEYLLNKGVPITSEEFNLSLDKYIEQLKIITIK